MQSSEPVLVLVAEQRVHVGPEMATQLSEVLATRGLGEEIRSEQPGEHPTLDAMGVSLARVRRLAAPGKATHRATVKTRVDEDW